MNDVQDPTTDPGQGPPPETPAGGPAPGDRRPRSRPLDAPPSDRYASASPPATVDPGASPRRGVLFGILVALFVGLIMVLLGSVLGFTAGLVVAAFFLGQLTAYGVRAGAGPSLGQTPRAWTAVLISLAMLIVVQIVLWLWARAEGGVLDPLTYLRDVYGLLVGIEAVVAAVGAWWGSR